MLTIISHHKIAFDRQPDFLDQDVRRLDGDLHTCDSYIKEAIRKIKIFSTANADRPIGFQEVFHAVSPEISNALFLLNGYKS